MRNPDNPRDELRIYPYSAEQLKVWIDDYFRNLDDDPSLKGSEAGFLLAVKMDKDTARKITKEGPVRYKKEQKLLKEAANRLRDHFCTSQAWSGQNSVKSMFLLKQPLWDDVAYTDKQESKVSTESTVRVIFGGKSNNSKDFE